ncbi:MAG: radical SAM protein [Candidatus Competibacteraceae bacterium]
MNQRTSRRIVLFQPAHRFGGAVQPRVELPQGLLAIGTPLDRAGYDVRIIDQRLESRWRELLLEELRREPVCVGVTSMTGPQIRSALEASRLVKQHSSVPVVWGGIHPTLMPEQTLRHEHIDLVVQGEGEETFFELVQALETGAPLGGVRGVWYKPDGTPRSTGPRPLIDLNVQPFPAYHLVDIRNYMPLISGIPHLSLETSRGCPFHCQYCYNTAAYHSTWRALSVEETVRRLQRIVNEYGIRHFIFTDDNFFGKKERALAIFRQLKELNLGIDCAKVDGHSAVLTALSDAELQILRDGGCTRLMIGIESASPRILGLLNKPQDIPAIVRFNRRLARFDIRPHYFFMMGIPTETQEELAQTVDLFLQLAADNPAAVPRLNVFTPFPGMADFDLAVQHGLKVPAALEEWVSFNFSTVNRYAPWLSADQKSLIRMLHFTSALAIRNNFVTPYKKTHWLVRLLASIYYPLAYLRVKKRFHQFPLEVKLAQWTGVYPHQA